MSTTATSSTQPMSYAEARYQESLRVARKRAKEIRGFYLSLSMYAVIIPILWVINLSTGTRLWAHWPTFGWGLGLVVQALTVFAGRSFFGPEWEQKKVDEIMAREKLRVVSGEKQLMQAQMRMLQAQIEPHFLFNTLANVRRLYEVAPAQGRLMLGALIDYLRHVLPGIRRPHSSLGEELELVRSYLQIQQLRMGERLAYRISADPSLLELMLPPLMLATLVENAIKHGLAPLPRGGCVEISATRRNAALEIEVRDDGRGFGGDSAGTGTGLANCHARLQALYGDRAWLRLEAIAPQGVRACLHLPAEAAHADEAIA